ncbi:MAG: outer membrane protein assembly factor BamB [Gammaproteobacteria bacterium]|nr:outer membrane protein assembly factor BamB [Gammaproteobacteria bacterium]
MNERRAKLLLACFAIALLSAGCGTVRDFVGGEDNSEPPAELVEFDAELKVEEVWSRSVGSGVSKYYLKLRPMVAGGRVYAADRKGRVSAYDALTGNELWDTDTGVPASGGPGGGEGLILIGSSDGDVVALSETDGAEKWRSRVSSEVLAAPAAAQGVVVVRTIDGKLFGLNAADGTRSWVYDRTVPVLTLRGTSSPVLSNGAAIAGFDSGRMVAVSLENGQTLWETVIAVPRGRSELERLVDIDADPVIEDRTVYVVTFQGRVAAIELFSGNVIWRRDMSSYAGLGVNGDHLYVTDADSFVWALDRNNSASLWRQDKMKLRGLTSPVGFDSYVVVGDFEGYVHWLSREDGHLLARSRVDSDGIISQPIAHDGMVYVYGKGGTLSALRVK